ncbi:hypothetical protein GP486_000806 [Trichoglossum hirsutum]|uniref:DUF2423 domain-containing protein n=1 Tax=Trichoglossum hirsutum TaxID=265104 RepID=A0A9P8RTM0_9PEZI|nr:hypothetical protein GP486_000806 [Trichoglossum hirsutum]
MAKSARSSVKKANKSNLRARVFGPAEDARIERLSAKLAQLVKEPAAKLSVTSIESVEEGMNIQLCQCLPESRTLIHAIPTGKMHTDDKDGMGEDEGAGATTAHTTTNGPILLQKLRRRKHKSSIVFQKHTKAIGKRGKPKGKK